MNAPDPIAGVAADTTTASWPTIRAPLTFIAPPETKPHFDSAPLTDYQPKAFFQTEETQVTTEDMRP